MDLNKKRREHNTKRVGEAIRGNKWDLNKPSVHVIPRTADKVEPKKPESGSPKPKTDFGDHEGHRYWPDHGPYTKPKPTTHPEPKSKPNSSQEDSWYKDEDSAKRRKPHRPYDDDKPSGGSPIVPKIKPKSPAGGQSKEIPTTKKYLPEYNKH